jgi:hypothetical protein
METEGKGFKLIFKALILYAGLEALTGGAIWKTFIIYHWRADIWEGTSNCSVP